jgi:Lrp/AsnC family leucine-responsive transcriptional regulator
MLAAHERQIACELQKNPRAAITTIAENLALPPHKVRTACDKLMRSGALKVHAIVAPEVLGQPLITGFRLRLAGERDKAVDTMAARAEFHWLVIANDWDTVLATANFTSFWDIQHFSEEVIRKTPGVREVTSQMYLDFKPIPYFNKEGREDRIFAPKGFDKLSDLDLKLLRCFQEDARMTYSDAGKRVGLSLSAARQRTMKLEESGILRFHVLPDPFVLGLESATMVSVKTTGPLEPIRRRLRILPGATFLAETTGTYAFSLEIFSDKASALDAQLNEILEIPGVLDIRTDHYRKIVRDTGTWSAVVR